MYPTTEALHIVAIIGFFGPILLLDLRLLGVGRNIDLPAMRRMAVPIALISLLLVVISGTLLFLTQTRELLASPLFSYKIALLILLLANALLLHIRMASISGGHAQDRVGLIDRFQAILSMLGWMVLINLGQWLAYV